MFWKVLGKRWMSGSMWWNHTDTWAYFLSQNRFHPLGFYLYTCSEASDFFLFNSQLPPTFPLALPIHCTFNLLKELSILEALTLSQIFQMKHTLYLCPPPWSIQVWVPILITFLQRQTRLQTCQSLDTLTDLSLADVIYLSPQPASLAWFFEDGGNN